MQFAHELPTHQTSDLMASLRFSYEPAEHLHSGNIVRPQFLGQCRERSSRACLGKCGQRIVAARSDALIQTGLPVPLPRTPVGHRLVPFMNFIGMSYSFKYPAMSLKISFRVNLWPFSASASRSTFMIIRFHSPGHVRPSLQFPPP